MKTRHEAGVRIETAVRGLLHHGALRQAEHVFDQGWKSALLPHLPLRHPFMLAHIDHHGVTRMLDALKERDGAIELRLLPGVDRRQPKQVGVGLAGEDHLIGFLPADARELLDGAGEYADLYEPKILAMRGLESGDVKFEMELIRPDLRQCSSCTTLHVGEHENCDECRSKRRRKTKTLDETAERPAVPVATAFSHLAAAQHDSRVA